jgi:hypothetical protein
MRKAGVLFAVTLVALALNATRALAQGTPPAYIARGHQVEDHQRVLNARIAHFRDSLVSVLRIAAPDLLSRIDPPPGIAPGYQLLPRILPAAAPVLTRSPPELVSYSWRWSDILFAREAQSLDTLYDRLRRTPAIPSRRGSLDSLVTDFRALIDRKRPIDADVNYNWLWQAEIVRVREGFESARALQNAIVQLHDLLQLSAQFDTSSSMTKAPGFDSILNARKATVDSGLAATVRRADVPAFVTFDSLPGGWRLSVPVYTDIDDTSFVNTFERTVESFWKLTTPVASYSVNVVITRVEPRALYCRQGAQIRADCSPPLRGASIDVNAHVSRFPPDVAVLTTGAGSIHVAAGRAVVVSPHDITTTVLAHEFGHLLGLRDAYLRGAVDIGIDGFIITELVVDQTDIMGNARAGSVTPAHFERLLAVKDVTTLMNDALSELYERKNAVAAIARFRNVLAKNPYHYGATVQLAKAFDAAGMNAEAVVQWKKVLEIAELARDTATAEQARNRLAGR